MHRSKVLLNAEQLNLTGCALVVGPAKDAADAEGGVGSTSGTNTSGIGALVVAEGGPKGIRFFKRLLLQRIDWRCANDLPERRQPGNACVCVWEGTVRERLFPPPFRLKVMAEAERVPDLLAKFNASHYWAAARNWAGAESL